MDFYEDKDYQLAMKKLKEAEKLPDNFAPKEAIIDHWVEVLTDTKTALYHDSYLKKRLYGE